MRFLVDEDLPRSLARELRAAGLEAVDVRDAGLRGETDDRIFAWAVAQGRAIVTGDLGFANILRYPAGSHAGIVVARFPNETLVATLNRAIADGLAHFTETDLRGNLVIIEPARVGFRRGT